MSDDGVRKAFAALAAANNNLLTATDDDVARFKMEWAVSPFGDKKKSDQSRGVWHGADKRTVILPLIGVVDLDKSYLGPYGNLYWSKNRKPDRDDLSKCKFGIAVTYPDYEEGHPLAYMRDQTLNQAFRVSKVQENTEDALKAAGHPQPNKTTDWVRFEETSDGARGWIHFSIGNVYVSSIKKIKPKDAQSLSPPKASTSSLAIKKEDIEDDEEGFFNYLGNHGLKHNDELPCWKENGERLGRTSPELRKELCQGRWIRFDVEMVMWNVKAENKRIFQLIAKKVVVLDAPPVYSLKGITFEPMSKDGTEIGESSGVASSSSDVGKAIGSTTPGGDADNSKGGDDDTVSEDDVPKVAKRAAEDVLQGDKSRVKHDDV